MIDSYHMALNARGNSTRGKAVFTKSCATCHKLGGEGQEVGPDLAALSSESDRAVWTVEVPRAGRFEVWADFACEASAVGNSYVLEGEAMLLSAKVASTGSWETYRDLRVGRVELPAGRQRLTVRSKGPIRGALIDLRGLRLVPMK